MTEPSEDTQGSLVSLKREVVNVTKAHDPLAMLKSQLARDVSATALQ